MSKVLGARVEKIQREEADAVNMVSDHLGLAVEPQIGINNTVSGIAVYLSRTLLGSSDEAIEAAIRALELAIWSNIRSWRENRPN